MDQNGRVRIGVYICHCGMNIVGTVNVAEVREFIAGSPEVAVARDYKFMCSDPGQALIQRDIRDLEINRVVVAACSPLMHELTFRRAAMKAGLNRYLVQIANIREHCSWVHDDSKRATEKAKALILGAVRQVALHIGGRMGTFDKTFPTLDCAACILTPKMVSVGHRENIRLLTLSEVAGLSGYIGISRFASAGKPGSWTNPSAPAAGSVGTFVRRRGFRRSAPSCWASGW